MSTRAVRTRQERVFLVLSATFLFLPHASAEILETRTRPYDCGVQSVYILLRLEGHAANLNRIERHLPPPQASGYSMSELREAAGACGLSLAGVRLEKQEQAIDRPMVAYFKREGHGHFMVLRPVGHTGKLVQVIDPGETPDVLDKVDLFSSPEWTGFALVPFRTNWASSSLFSFLLITVLAIATWVVVRLRKARLMVHPEAR